jgi:hypothetical protein
MNVRHFVRVETAVPAKSLSRILPITYAVTRDPYVALTVGTVAACWIVIVSHAHAPIYDQRWLLDSSHTILQPLEGGISSRWLAGLVGLFAGHDLTLHDTVTRCAAAALVLCGLSFSLTAVGASRAIWVACFGSYLVSGHALWNISSDVLAGAALAWLIGLWASGRTVALVPVGIVLSLSKPDALLSGLALTAILLPSWSLRLALCASTLAVVALGAWSPLPSIDRATLALCQHWAYWQAGMTGWYDCGPSRDRDFGAGARWLAMIQHPAHATFVWRSIQETWSTLTFALAWGWIALYGLASWLHRTNPLVRGMAACLGLNLLTWTAFAFVHVRYFGRLLPGLLLVIAWAGTRTPRLRPFLYAGLAATALAHAIWFLPTVLRNGEWNYD